MAPKPPLGDLDQVDKVIDRLLALGVSNEAVAPVRDWVRDRRQGVPETVVYFGCWDQVGHFLHLPNGRRPYGRSGVDDRFDMNSAGPFRRLDGALTPKDTTKQSAAAIHHRDGWTALAMHDYTVDNRGASNSVFVMDADTSFERALYFAGQHFPKIVERIAAAAPITLVQTEGATDT